MSAVPATYRPIQSVLLGFAIPLHVAVTLPPATTVAGFTLRLDAKDDALTVSVAVRVVVPCPLVVLVKVIVVGP